MPVRLETQQTLSTKLAALVESRQQMIAERERLIEQIGIVSDEIAREMALADQKALRVGAFQLTLIENPGRVSLDKRRLLELGVSPEVITQASVRGTPSVSLQVRKASEG
jgi:hypothetical protein